MGDRKMLSVPEVADKLGLTINQVYRRLHRGDLAWEFGGWMNRQYLVDADVLDEYINAGRPLSPPAKDTTMLAVPEVSKLTGFTVETVRKLCYRGVLTYVRGTGKAGHLRIHKASVDAYLKNKAAA